MRMLTEKAAIKIFKTDRGLAQRASSVKSAGEHSGRFAEGYPVAAGHTDGAQGALTIVP